MRLDSASRSFFALLGVALGPYLALGMFACGSLSFAAYGVLTGNGGTAVRSGPVGWIAFGFLTVAAVGVLAAVRSLHQQVAATRRLGAHVRAHRTDVPADVSAVAAWNRIPRIDIVASHEPYAFTYGLLAPRVVISSGLLSTTTAEELDAVLAHERYHVASLDPLKTLIARVIPAAFFFLPALGHLGERYFAGRELAADRRATRRSTRAAVAGALYKTAATPSPPLVASAAAMSGNELLDVRIAQLEAGREPTLPPVPRRAATLTFAGLAASTIGIVTTIALAGSPGTVPLGMADELVGAVVCGLAWLVGATLLYGHLAARR